MKRSTFLAISAILALLFGLGFLFLPGQSVTGFGIEATPAVISFARAVGATLVGLAILNWMARNDRMSVSLRAILWANFVIQGLSAILNILDITSGVVNPAGGWFGEAIHVLLAIGFLYYLYARTSEPA